MDDIRNYYSVIVDVWKIFKKGYENLDKENMGDEVKTDVAEFEKKYKQKKYGPRVYDLAMRTMRMWWSELGEIQKVRADRHGKIQN